MRAFLKTDPHEDPIIIEDLKQRLEKQNINLYFTQKDWRDIPNPSEKPFLYYRNAFIRFEKEKEILKFHSMHDFIFIQSMHEEEIISVNPSSNSPYPYSLDIKITYKEPSCPALPILIGTHQRPEYLKLTLNSLFYSTKNISDQKFYLALSHPDPETEIFAKKIINNDNRVEAVATEKNVGYGIHNFAAKYFNLSRFIHFEDDGLLPESTNYLYPFWTKQFNYRFTTADYVGFRVSIENQTQWHHKQKLRQGESVNVAINDNLLWNYFNPKPYDLPPISGLGTLIDSPTMYKGYKNIGYAQVDLNLYRSAKLAAVTSLPVYHLGNNQLMDYNKKSQSPKSIDRIHKGVNLRTSQVREIDLLLDWAEHPN